MNDLISRSALIEKYEQFLARASIDPVIRAFMVSVLCTVENAPAVDAEVVRHATLERKPVMSFHEVTATPLHCSECDAQFIALFNRARATMYCPCCGAKRKMDAEVEG